MNKERGINIENLEDPIAKVEELMAKIKELIDPIANIKDQIDPMAVIEVLRMQNQINPIANIKELIVNIEELIDNTKKLIENIKNPRVKVKLVLQNCPDIQTKQHLNELAFSFNTRVPGTVHSPVEVKTTDGSYRLTVLVDETHFKEFKKYIEENDKDIICVFAAE